MKTGANAFTLLETMIAMVILLMIVSTVAGIQYRSLSNILHQHDQVIMLHRLKRELHHVLTTHNPNDKLSPRIDNADNDIAIFFDIEPYHASTLDQKDFQSLYRVNGQIRWFELGEKKQMDVTCLWYYPSRDEKTKGSDGEPFPS